ncbi:MAG: isochorismate synthase [Rhodoglobus sp.]
MAVNSARAFPALAATTRLLDRAPSLLDELPSEAPLAFLRNGDGIIGLGETLRLEFSGPSRIMDAAHAWRAVTSAATVVDPVGLSGTGLIAFGSFAFGDHSTQPSLLIVPSCIVGRCGDVGWVTHIGADNTGPGTEKLRPQMRPSARAEAPFSGRFAPGAMSPDDFVAAVRSAVASIRAGQARKLVLARDLVASIPVDADLRRPIMALAAAYPDTFTFAVDGLLGSSPETLIRALRGSVSARVLAGSAARGLRPEDDAAAAAVLSTSAKDLAEHDFALHSVLDALGPHSTELSFNTTPFALDLPNLWHLASDITGTLTDGSSALDLIAALHPTAAVAGNPRQAALDLIARLEPFDRGRYAGPVGWVDGAGDGEWAIALRCAALSQSQDSASAELRVTAYAGAGIVTDSDPQHELAETELKFRPIIDAFR